MSHLTRRRFVSVASCALLRPELMAAEPQPAAWQKDLEAIRLMHDLPGLGGAVVSVAGCQELGVCGVRKKGTQTAVTPQDLWHLGSNTKAMTSTLAALAVEEGRLRWDSTPGEVFPRQKALKKTPLAGATLTQLLSHWSGLPANAPWGSFMADGRKDLRSRREAVLEFAAQLPNLPAPGAQHLYSNLGYVIAGHMLEEVWAAPWEKLMEQRLFKPLGIEHAGFGGVGTPGRTDQPWPHNGSGEPMPNNGPLVDNAAVLGPAGTVHMSLEDWSRFIAEHLAGRAGRGRLLKSRAAYEHLHTATQAGSPYAYGWMTADRSWGGKVLNHNGSNTMNHSMAWLAPEKGFAVIACTNTGAANSAKALDDVAGLLITACLKK